MNLDGNHENNESKTIEQEENKIEELEMAPEDVLNLSNPKDRKYLTVSILFLTCLLKYMDRFTIAGVLRDIQKYYNINDGQAGLLQTLFILSYMLIAPLFGYLGDRYSRKMIIIFGMIEWTISGLCGSFIPRNYYWLFALIRTLVGIGEASHSCVAPTIIGDLFVNEQRTRVLSLYYLAAPLGSGLGYIIGSNVASALNDWRWALRVTPAFGVVCIVLTFIFVEEPKRGQAEGTQIETINATFIADVISILKNKCYLWTTIGFTFASFILGSFSWWGPTFIELAIESKGVTPKHVALNFGIVTCLGGLIGVGLVSLFTQKFRLLTESADPLICAISSLVGLISLYISILIPRMVEPAIYWLVVGIVISSLCMSWTLVAEITIYVIQPTKRSMASALSILICHLFGDAASPYFIGSISDAIRNGQVDSYFNRFTSLQNALYIGPIFGVFAFGSYLFASIYINDHKKKPEVRIRELRQEEISYARME